MGLYYKVDDVNKVVNELGLPPIVTDDIFDFLENINKYDTGDNDFSDDDIVFSLKPCPFCGNKDVHCLSACEINDRLDELKTFAVCCDATNGGCGATGCYKMTRQKAVESWNKRV